MNKKFLNAILFGALILGSAGSITSCKDYDDEIDAINQRITEMTTKSELSSQVATLQTSITAAAAQAAEALNQAKAAQQSATAAAQAADKAVADAKAAGDAAVVAAKEAAAKAAAAEVAKAEEAVKAAEAEVAKVAGLQDEVAALKDQLANIKEDASAAAKKEIDEFKEQLQDKMDKLDELKEKMEEAVKKAENSITDIDLMGTIAYAPATGTWALTPVAAPANLANNYHHVTAAEANAAATRAFVADGGKAIKAGQILSSVNGNYLVRVAPASVNAADLNFQLVTTSGIVAPIKVVATPFEGTLTRADDEGSALWVLSFVGDEDLVVNNPAAQYVPYFQSGAAFHAFALAETSTGYSSGYDFRVTPAAVAMPATPATLNNVALAVASVAAPIAAPRTAAQQNTINLNTKYTIGFNVPANVYDAHIDISDAEKQLYGIVVDGMSFTATKLADNITVADFQVKVHYMQRDAVVVERYLYFRPTKSYAKTTTLASQNYALVAEVAAPNVRNNKLFSLDPMFADISNTTLWKNDVKSATVDAYYLNNWGAEVAYAAAAFDNIQFTNAAGVAIAPVATATAAQIGDAKQVNVDLSTLAAAPAFQRDRANYVRIKFYDGAGGTGDLLNTVVIPFTVSVPSLTDLLKKAPTVFAGSDGTAYLNEFDLGTYGGVDVNGDGYPDKIYSFKYAFQSFAAAYAGGTRINFVIDPNQKLADNTLVNTLASIGNNNSANAYISVDNMKAYGVAINVQIAGGAGVGPRYLSQYDYTEAERAAAAFTIKVLSPIKEGTITAKDGSKTIKVTATSAGTKIAESDLLAKTYSGVQYKLFPDVNPGAAPWIATAWSTPYITVAPTFATQDITVFSVTGAVTGAEFAATGSHDKVADGYISITPVNVAATGTAGVTINVLDAWGIQYRVTDLKVQVTPGS